MPGELGLYPLCHSVSILTPFKEETLYVPMPPVAERLRQAYPALLERAGVDSILANSDAQNVPCFRRWRFEMKLSPCSRASAPNFTPSGCV
jgi:hypothetical protein